MKSVPDLIALCGRPFWKAFLRPTFGYFFFLAGCGKCGKEPSESLKAGDDAKKAMAALSAYLGKAEAAMPSAKKIAEGQLYPAPSPTLNPPAGNIATSTPPPLYVLPEERILELQKDLRQVHSQSPFFKEIQIAFFAFMDQNGRVLRSNLDVDHLSGMPLFETLPKLKSPSYEEKKGSSILHDVGPLPKTASYALQEHYFVFSASLFSPGDRSKVSLVLGISFGHLATEIEEKNEAKRHVALVDIHGVYCSRRMPSLVCDALKSEHRRFSWSSFPAGGELKINDSSSVWAIEKKNLLDTEIGVICVRHGF